MLDQNFDWVKMKDGFLMIKDTQKKDGVLKTVLKALLLGLVLVSSEPLCAKENSKKCTSALQPKEKYKKYLEDSVWIVPPSTLLAYQYLDGTHIPLQDQTIWVINRYDNGYFFGDAYTALDGSPTTQKTFVGSITPAGAVYITFYPVSGSLENTDIVNGIGTFETRKGINYFVMQMNSAQNSLTGLTHMSLMIPVKPDDYFYQHLPGVDLSVPEFISQF